MYHFTCIFSLNKVNDENHRYGRIKNDFFVIRRKRSTPKALWKTVLSWDVDRSQHSNLYNLLLESSTGLKMVSYCKEMNMYAKVYQSSCIFWTKGKNDEKPMYDNRKIGSFTKSWYSLKTRTFTVSLVFALRGCNCYDIVAARYKTIGHQLNFKDRDW